VARTTSVHISPRSAGAGLAGTGCQNPDRGVIGVQLLGAQSVIAQRVDQRIDERTTGSAPVGERAALNMHLIAGMDLALAKMAGDRNTWAPGRGPEVRACIAVRDGARWRARLHDLLAGPTGILGLDVLDHLPVLGHKLMYLGDVLAQSAQRPTAIRASA
jgi:hypothetical protein